jgi:hypothetical protein
MKRRLWAIFTVVAGLELSILSAADGPRTVSGDEARLLVLQALPSKTRQLPKFGLDQYQDPHFPQFYFFEATWAGVPNGSSVIGHYAVDSSTGDVWNAIQCEKEDTRALRKLQERIRLQIGLSDSEYQKMKRQGPACS